MTCDAIQQRESAQGKSKDHKFALVKQLGFEAR